MRSVSSLDSNALARRVGRRRTRFRVTPDAARRSLMLIGGHVEAGSNFNVVPGRCVFTVDRRMNPEEDFEAERQALFAVFDEARRDGVKLDVEVFQEGHPSGSSETAPLARALATHVRAITGKAPRFEMCPGLLEIRFYADQGMPAYAYGPGLLSISHGPKEFVDTTASSNVRRFTRASRRVCSSRRESNRRAHVLPCPIEETTDRFRYFVRVSVCNAVVIGFKRHQTGMCDLCRDRPSHREWAENVMRRPEQPHWNCDAAELVL